MFLVVVLLISWFGGSQSFFGKQLKYQPISRTLDIVRSKITPISSTLKYVKLKFMSTVSDAPPQIHLNIDSRTDVKVKEAVTSDLSAIVALRVNVFYPEVCRLFA
jgi:hypothetical protein